MRGQLARLAGARFGRASRTEPDYSGLLEAIADGDYFVDPIPSFQCQFASREQVDRYLKAPDLVEADPLWQEFGFDSASEYAFWAPRLCGLVCMRMILGGYGESLDKTIAELTARGVELGGYEISDRAGRFVDKGWFYRPLLELVGEYGVEGRLIGGATIDTVCAEVLLRHPVVASVHPGVIRGDLDALPSDTSGGHLVVVIGFRWSDGRCSGIYLHNPSGRSRDTQERVFVSAERFTEAFAGRGLSCWR